MENFPRNWPFVQGIHQSLVNSPHKGQWRGALMFSLICVWINDQVNNREAGDLRRYHVHYDLIVMSSSHFKISIKVWWHDYCALHWIPKGLDNWVCRYEQTILLLNMNWDILHMVTFFRDTCYIKSNLFSLCPKQGIDTHCIYVIWN